MVQILSLHDKEFTKISPASLSKDEALSYLSAYDREKENLEPEQQNKWLRILLRAFLSQKNYLASFGVLKRIIFGTAFNDSEKKDALGLYEKLLEPAKHQIDPNKYQIVLVDYEFSTAYVNATVNTLDISIKLFESVIDKYTKLRLIKKAQFAAEKIAQHIKREIDSANEQLKSRYEISTKIQNEIKEKEQEKLQITSSIEKLSLELQSKAKDFDRINQEIKIVEENAEKKRQELDWLKEEIVIVKEALQKHKIELENSSKIIDSNRRNLYTLQQNINSAKTEFERLQTNITADTFQERKANKNTPKSPPENSKRNRIIYIPDESEILPY